MKKLFFFCFTLFILLGQLHVQAQSVKPYTEGPVWIIQYIQSKSGMGQLYLQNLSDGWIKIMKEAKTEGTIVDYKVFSGLPGSAADWDLMLMIELKNHAAQDGLNDKMDALRNKLYGTDDAEHKAALMRNDLRTTLGGKTVQELIFK
jgi:hypothetical protein